MRLTGPIRREETNKNLSADSEEELVALCWETDFTSVGRTNEHHHLPIIFNIIISCFMLDVRCVAVRQPSLLSGMRACPQVDHVILGRFGVICFVLRVILAPLYLLFHWCGPARRGLNPFSQIWYDTSKLPSIKLSSFLTRLQYSTLCPVSDALRS